MQARGGLEWEIFVRNVVIVTQRASPYRLLLDNGRND